jgi:chemotaxis-related protein WspB
MQLLTFTVAGQPYAIESRRVIEVLPLVPARPIPLMPDYVRGIFTYRGQLVPLVDLRSRFRAEGTTPAAPPARLSTRVIVVEFIPSGAAPTPGTGAGDQSATPVRLGLIAEDVISIQSAAAADVTFSSMELGHAPFLGRILRLEGSTVQVISVEHLLPVELMAGIFPLAFGARGA